MLNILIIFQALIFAFVFAHTKKDNRSERILFLYEFAYLLAYSCMTTHFLGLYNIYTLSHFVLIPLFALFPILFFYYILTLYKGRLRRLDYLHLLFPAIIFFVSIPFLFLLDQEIIKEIVIEKTIPNRMDIVQRSFFFINNKLLLLLFGIQPVIYLFLCFYYIWQFKQTLKNYYSNLERLNLKWAIKVLILFSILFSLKYVFTNTTYFLTFVLFINVYFGIQATNYRYIFYKLHIKDKISINLSERSENAFNSLDQDKKENIKSLIESYMSKEKPYLKPDFTLIELASAIGTNRQYASGVINELYKTNFNSYINSHRIKWFLDDPDLYLQYSVDGIITQCGFRSKSSFYNAFKKETGQTPKEYFYSIKEQAFEKQFTSSKLPVSESIRSTTLT